MADDIDADLVERCLRGEADAFEALVAKYQRRVIGLCFRHLRAYEDACDLAQEIFANAFGHLHDFRGGSRFSTWLYRISLNACYNRGRYGRSKGRDGVVSLDALLEDRPEGVDHSRLLDSGQPGALENLELREDLQELDQALRSLEPAQRAVVELVDIEEMDYASAAQILDLPVNTVRSRLSRARASLKVRLMRLRRRREGRP